MFYTNRIYKTEMFKKEYPNFKLIVIDNILAYTKKTYKKELEEWKKTRLLN